MDSKLIAILFNLLSLSIAVNARLQPQCEAKYEAAKGDIDDVIELFQTGLDLMRRVKPQLSTWARDNQEKYRALQDSLTIVYSCCKERRNCQELGSVKTRLTALHNKIEETNNEALQMFTSIASAK